MRSADGWSQRLEDLAAKQVARHVPPGEVVTAALSGGVDSVVLLELLRKAAPGCAFELRALHVNHGLSVHALRWERFCREHCRRRGIAFRAVRITVAGGGANVEAQARAARYRAFAASGAAFVALAHHRDDQAETLLFNLLRGSGVHGLAGMPAVRGLDVLPAAAGTPVVRLIRPLLGVARSEIEHYARSKRLRWVDDDSNRDQRFGRNFLRLRVLPLLQTRFPGCGETLARTAAHLADAASLLDELAASDRAAVGAGARLHAGRLLALGELRAANALRHFLASRGQPPPTLARTREILRQLGTRRADAQPAIELQQAAVRRFRGWIELVPHTRVETRVECVSWSGEGRIGLADGAELRAARASGKGISAARLQAAPVTIRARRGGERIRLARGGRTRTLKNLLQEAGVAPWVRARMPLLYCGEQLVWAPFVGIAAEFQAAAGEPAWQFSWREPGGTSLDMR